MKKLFLALSIIFLLTGNIYAAVEWNKLEPLGSRNISDLDYYIQNNQSALDRVLANYNTVVLSYNSASQLTASPGEVVCSNSDGSVRKMRQNTTSTTITWANIDTGAEAASTQYYVYANCDADATTATFKISGNSTTPTGLTYYKKIGQFYNDGSSNITNLYNSKETSWGAFTAKSAGTTYQATTDGFVVGYTSGTAINNGFTAYTDASSSPTTLVQSGYTLWVSGGSDVKTSIAFPVKQGNYYVVNGSPSNSYVTALYFVPLALNGGN